MREHDITALGYQGSYASVNTYLRCLRTGICLPPSPMPPAERTLTVKQARFLFLRPPTDLRTEEQQDLETILGRSAELALIYQLTQRFRAMLHCRRADQLEDWLQRVLRCPCPELHSFVSGLRKDWQAVVAAFTLEWNNGMVEGHVNRLKLIKRQMYGRAEFDLLRQRVLHCA